MCQEMAKLHLGHSIYHLLCEVSMQFFQQGIKIYKERYLQHVPLSGICSGRLLLLPSG